MVSTKRSSSKSSTPRGRQNKTAPALDDCGSYDTSALKSAITKSIEATFFFDVVKISLLLAFYYLVIRDSKIATFLYENYAFYYTNYIVPFSGFRLSEALIAVVSFAIWGFFFTAISMANVKKMKIRKQKKRPSCWYQRIIATSTSDAFFWQVMNIGIYLGLIEVTQRLFIVPMGLLPLVIQAAPSEPPGLLQLLAEVSFSIWLYDCLFWGIHRSFHKVQHQDDGEHQKGKRSSFLQKLQSWWHSLHLLHHDHYTQTQHPLHVLVTFHHHFLDASLQVAINIVVQQVSFFPSQVLFHTNRHILSKFLHNIVVTYLLVEAHSGFDLCFMTHRVLPGIFGGAVRHQVHHDIGRKYFHQFFKYFDDWEESRLNH